MSLMGPITSPATAHRTDDYRETRVRRFFRALTRMMFGDYRPELHYMRGPGPACAAARRARR
jgi:hypothetical protein